MATSISGELRDFCTVKPATETSAGNWLRACETRSCESIWSVSGLVLTSKSTVSWVRPLLALIDSM